MGLSEDQLNDLHKAILAYLKENKYNEAFDAFKDECKLTPESKKGILSAKWRSIMKLQKQILELEKINSQLLEDCNSSEPSKKDNSQRLPRVPPKFACTGHRDVVTCVRFHPAGNGLVASCGEDSLIKMWDSEQGREEKTMTGHQDAVQSIAFHPSGATLASCSADLTIKIWDTEAYRCTKTLTGHEHNISCVTYSKDGKQLISCSRDTTIRFWSVATGVCTDVVKGHSDWVRQVIVSPDGKQFVSCAHDLTVKVWDMEEKKQTASFTPHEHIVEAIAFSNALVDDVIFNHVIPKEERTRIKEEALKAVESKEEVKKEANVGGKYLLTASRDKTIKLWALKTQNCLLELKGHSNWVRAVCFHPGGQFVLSASDDKNIRVWDLTKEGECVRVLETAHEPFVTSLDAPKNLPLIASGGTDNLVKFWECK